MKIRGCRVEVSEIEEALAQQPEVERAVVCARTTSGGDVQLVAYVVNRPGQVVTAEVLRAALQAALPSYMLPAAFVFLKKFPLTANGKINREQLRQIQPPAAVLRPEAEPATATEKLLAGIWQEVLRRGPVGRHDHFLDLGGDSLSATVVAAQVYSALSVEIDLRACTEHPRLLDLAGAIDGMIRAGAAKESPAFPRAPRGVPVPLSFAQQRIWKYSCQPKAAANYTLAFSLRLRGPLQPEILRDSFNYLVGRHEMLRTTFEPTSGGPVQIIHPSGPVPLPVLDFSAAANPEAQVELALREEAERPFDLARLPLVRLVLVRVSAEDHWLLRISHHIISDAWSWKLLSRELAVVYEARLRGEAPPLPESEPCQYADYSAWQHDLLRPEGTAYRELVRWWAQQLAGQPAPVRLPFKRLLRRRRANPADGLLWWGLDPDVSRRLDQLGRAEGATYYVVRLTAFAALLSAEMRARDLVLGTYVTNRTRAEAQGMFGYFANLAALRLACDPARTFSEWLAAVRRAVGEMQARSEIPYEQLGEELRRRGVRAPEIRAIFSVADHTAPVRFGGVEITWEDRHMAAMPWGFTLMFDQHHEDRRCYAAFDAHMHHPKRVRDWLGRFQRFLDAASRHPELPVGKLIALSKSGDGFLRTSNSQH